MAGRRPRIVILGAGPAGLGAGFKLRQTGKAEVTVLERNPAVGGNAGSFDLGGQRVDFGSHRLHPSCDPEILRDIRKLLGSDLLKRPRHGRIWLRDRWIRFPLKPLDLLLRLDRRFAIGALRDMLLAGVTRHRNDPESFAGVLRVQLGPTICEHFYLPYTAKIWGRDPDRLAAVQAHRRVAAGSFVKLLRKVFSAVPGVKPLGFDYFFYPRRGFGQISEAFASAATDKGATLTLGESAVRLQAPSSRSASWTVVTQVKHGRHSLEADEVWSTIPITRFVRLIKPEPPDEVLAATEAIHYRAMILVYLQLGVDRFSEFDAHYFPDSSFTITRLSEPKNYADSYEPRGSTILCAELPCSTDDEIWRMTPQLLGELVTQDLERAGLQLSERPLAVEIRRLPQAYPIYDLGFEEHLRRLEDWLETLPGVVTFGRQGLFVHDNSHHALFMAYCAVDCLVDGSFDRQRWREYRRIFETHVVED